LSRITVTISINELNKVGYKLRFKTRNSAWQWHKAHNTTAVNSSIGKAVNISHSSLLLLVDLQLCSQQWASTAEEPTTDRPRHGEMCRSRRHRSLSDAA